MNGKTAVAPCGHTGEHIIGNFILCRQGCGGGTKSSRRGEVGHVENCACKPCQLRRITHTIVVKSKQGKVIATIPWDGVEDEIKFIPGLDAWASDFQMLDKDGKVVTRGILSDGYGNPVALVGGWSATIKAKFLVNAAAFVVEVSQGMKKFDPKKVLVTFKGIELKPCDDGFVTNKWA